MAPVCVLKHRFILNDGVGNVEDGGDFKQEFPWHLGQKTFFKVNVKLERDSEWRSLAKLDCGERRDASRN